MKEYVREELFSLYELARMYYDAGLLSSAEQIFAGLREVDRGLTPCRLGLGFIRLDQGMYQDAADFFRSELQEGRLLLQARLGLAAAFMAMKEFLRSRTILSQIGQEMREGLESNSEARILWETLVLRCAAEARVR